MVTIADCICVITWYLDTCPKNDVILFSEKRLCACD